MKYFLISNMSFLGHQPEQNKVKRFHHCNIEFWSVALDNIDMFVVNTYDFDAFIIYVKPEEISLIKNFDGYKHVIVKSTMDTSILKELRADIDLSVNVYFKN